MQARWGLSLRGFSGKTGNEVGWICVGDGIEKVCCLFFIRGAEMEMEIGLNCDARWRWGMEFSGDEVIGDWWKLEKRWNIV